MKITIRNQYSNEVTVDVEKFRMSNWQYKEFQMTLINEPSSLTTFYLTSVGFRTPNWTTSKLIWEMNPDSISHFSSES